jgi:hypothetical protein
MGGSRYDPRMKYEGPYTEEVRVETRKSIGGTQLYLAAPQVPPSEPLLNSVRLALKDSVDVGAAYAFTMSIGGTAPCLSIGIYFDHEPSSSELEEVFANVSRRMRPLIGDRTYVDLLPLDPKNLLTIAVRDMVVPFYRRMVQ